MKNTIITSLCAILLVVLFFKMKTSYHVNIKYCNGVTVKFSVESYTSINEDEILEELELNRCEDNICDVDIIKYN